MSEGPGRSTRIAVALGLALATAAAFAGVLRAGFITLDDPMLVVNNDHVRSGLTFEGLLWAFGTGTAANWHPLTWISHMLDVQLFGLRPWGHHATSLALHVASTVLLLLALARLTRAFWPSALVAALFALHPLHVESVAWVSERKDVLSTFFLVLVLLAYAYFVEKPVALRYLAVLGLYALGLMCKPMLVTLPFVLLLLDFWPLGRMEHGTVARLLREKIPLFVFAAGASLTAYLVQGQSGAIAPSQMLTLPVRASNALASTARYLAKTLWPLDLAAYYPHPKVVEPLPALVGLTLIVLGTWLVVRARSRRPFLLVGWFWYLGMLVPVIGIVQVGGQAMADRYTYVPLVGIFVMVAWGARDLLADRRVRSAAWIAAPVLVGLGLATWRQVGFWRSTRTLFEHTIEVTGVNSLAEQCLGNALLLENDLEGGIAHLTEALRITPDFPDAENSLGSALGSKGLFEEALPHFRAALRSQPRSAMTHYNLGFALSNLGRIDEAIGEYEAALKIDPVQFAANSKLGIALGSKGKLAEALEHLEQAIALRPEDAETRRSLAVTLTLLDRVEEGIDHYERLLDANPKDFDALNNIAWIRAAHLEAVHRNAREAVELAERARDGSPEENAVLFDTLAAAYAEAGRFEEAVRACEKAIELARAQGEESEARRFEEHLELFRAGKPVHFR